MLLDDNTWYLHSEPQEYVLASYMNEPGLPHAHQTEHMLQQLGDLSTPLQESLVAHLYACIMSVTKKSAKIGGNGRSGRGQSKRTADDNDRLPEARVLDRPTSSSSQQQQPHGKNRLSAALQSTAQTIDMINAQGSINSHQDAGGKKVGGGVREGSDATSCVTGSNEEQQQQLPQFSSQKEFLNYICSVSVTGDSTLTPFTKLWVVLARIDGGSGQLLGQAVRGGYDGFRAWLCSLLVWGTAGRAFPDRSLPASKTTLQRAVRELSVLVEESRNSELRLSVVVIFILEALQGLARRLEAPIGVHQLSVSRGEGGEESTSTSVESLSPASSSGTVTSLCNLEANCGLSSCYEQLPQSAVTQRGGRSYVHLDSSGGPGSDKSSASTLRVPLQRLGQVLPLHCGHNGWPAHHELAAITEFFVMNHLG
jgi:hypothetical protein